ncbi:MAG: Uncharacterised protein [Alphaproteobacteria bacterium]|nr:MAG: Uncharacterised protein [Alphaproteobacteria bacterium]
MQKFTKTTRTLAALLVSGTALTGVASAAEITANVGATTDYIWRGDTQAAGDASLSGGFDADLGNGLAIGTWVGSLGASATDANYELDLYASYSTEVGGLPLEVGYISYMYPGVADSGNDFSDIYIGTSVAGISITYYMNAGAEDDAYEDAEESYLSLDYEYALSDDISIGLHYGSQTYGEESDEYADNDDTAISISKGDMTMTISGNEDDDTRAIISWGAEF